MVYAKFHLPGTRWVWYVFEGQPEGQDFVFFGFVAGRDSEFTRCRLSDLQAMRGLSGKEVERDLTFIQGRLTDVVPAPDSLRPVHFRDQERSWSLFYGKVP